MNKIILSGICAGVCLFCSAQENTVSSGGDASGAGGSVSYSVGQIDYINMTGSNGNINQGVQQPFEFFKDAGLEEEGISVSLYPNPTNEFIILEFDNAGVSYNYHLFDMNGKLLQEGSIESGETKIDMRTYPPAEYHLQLNNELNKTQSVKIIKH